MNSAILLEEASRETLKKWQSIPEYKKIAEKLIENAIVQAVSLNDLLGFTRTNNARNKVNKIGNDGIIYALLYNMIQLSDYKHQKIGCTLGVIDPYIILVNEKIKNNDIGSIEQEIYDGFNEIIKRQNKSQIDTKDYNQIVYEFAKSILLAYSWYNTSYHTVNANDKIITSIDQYNLERLNQYYLEKKRIVSHKII